MIVDSNGRLALGSALASDPTETIDELQDAGVPTVAGLWNNLLPNEAGEIYLAEFDDAIGVFFREVPEERTTYPYYGGANSFNIILKSSGDILLHFYEISSEEGLVGWSCGSGAALPLWNLNTEMTFYNGANAVGFGTGDGGYELFRRSNTFDLSEQFLHFSP
jgi:hypothetical protein